MKRIISCFNPLEIGSNVLMTRICPPCVSSLSFNPLEIGSNVLSDAVVDYLHDGEFQSPRNRVKCSDL